MGQQVQVSGKTLKMTAEVLKRLGNGGLDEDVLQCALQAVLEDTPLGESSRDNKIVARFEGVSFTEANFRETVVIDGQHMKRHRNGGGWVPAEQDEHDESMPFVDETAYVGPFAIVSDNARVFGYAQVFGYARVFGNAWVFDFAQVFGDARVCGDARVFGNAWVCGDELIDTGDHKA